MITTYGTVMSEVKGVIGKDEGKKKLDDFKPIDDKILDGKLQRSRCNK